MSVLSKKSINAIKNSATHYKSLSNIDVSITLTLLVLSCITNELFELLKAPPEEAYNAIQTKLEEILLLQFQSTEKLKETILKE